MSSQEDITLVNLHMQINRPIVDSPLLMASYVTHLAQLRCSNWSHCSMPYGADAFSMPLFQQNEDGGLVYIGSKLGEFALRKISCFRLISLCPLIVPHFDTYSNWREVRVVSRFDANSTTSTTSGIPSNFATAAPRAHPWDPSVMVREAEKGKHKEEQEQEFLSSQCETATRNSVVIRFKGQIDLLLTPLLLEGLQR
jgi:hypothetical protein